MTETIVVIDDHHETANLVSVILKREGYRVFTEHSGAAGLVTAEQRIPNLILLDVMMPDMDGLETCRRIRKVEAIKNVPVILFTAKDQADEKWEGFQAGATDYLTKPTDAEELKQRVRAILDRSPDAPSSTASLAQTKGALAVKEKDSQVSQPRTQITAFIGARGGSGTTTAAINTAMMLSRNYYALLVDMDMAQGHIGLYLNRKVAGGMNELANSSVMSISAQVRNEVVSITPQLQMLLSKPNLSGEHKVLVNDQIPHLSEALLRSGSQVVVDGGLGINSINQPLLERADHVVVCVRPERLAVSGAKPLLAELENIILPTAEVHLLLMDFGQGSQLPVKAVETYLGRKISQKITIPIQQMAGAVNKAKPLVMVFPDSSLPADFAKLSKTFVDAS